MVPARFTRVIMCCCTCGEGSSGVDLDNGDGGTDSDLDCVDCCNLFLENEEGDQIVVEISSGPPFNFFSVPELNLFTGSLSGYKALL